MKLPLRVDIDLTLEETVLWMNATSETKYQLRITGVALDTRAIHSGDLFFALTAARDGHDFVKDAFAKGAVAAVVERKVDVKGPLLCVPNAFEALAKLAHEVRRRWQKTVVAISGSNGKTTTKEMTSAILGAAKTILKAPGTWNNALGVPLTLLLLRPAHEVAILEMGMNDFGELASLGKMAAPDIAVLTNVGPVHLEKLGSVDGVARAKRELFESLSSKGTAVVNLDDHWISQMRSGLKSRVVTISMNSDADIRATIAKDLGAKGLELDVTYGKEKLQLHSPFVGTHNVYNLLCAMGAAYVVGVPANKLQEGLDTVERPSMRLEILEFPQNIRVINDCYNANPASTAVALEVVKEISPKRRIAILGDMMELGDYAPRAHRDIGIKVARLGYAYLFAIGQFAGDLVQGAVQGGMDHAKIQTAKDHQALADAIDEVVEPGDTLLVKGSRGMKMETVTQALTTKWKGANA